MKENGIKNIILHKKKWNLAEFPSKTETLYPIHHAYFVFHKTTVFKEQFLCFRKWWSLFVTSRLSAFEKINEIERLCRTRSFIFHQIWIMLMWLEKQCVNIFTKSCKCSPCCKLLRVPCTLQGYAGMLQYLYDMKCDIHLQTATLRRTAFHFAVLRHKAACFHKLLSFGAKPDARDTFGNTACHYASEDGDVLLLDVLLRQRTVDPNAQVSCRYVRWIAK